MEIRDKYDLVLHIVQNAEKYSEEEVKEILSDPETRDIYNILCDTVSSVGEKSTVDVNSQWQAFSRKHLRKKPRMYWFGSRAASIAVFLVVSLVAVAIGLGVAVFSISPEGNGANEETANAIEQITEVEGESIAEKSDSVHNPAKPILFENVDLQTIMAEVAKAFNVQVIFANTDVSSLHLYYKLDSNLSLDEIICQLNNFEQINITRSGNIVTIE